jgi:hypothetical protein
VEFGPVGAVIRSTNVIHLTSRIMVWWELSSRIKFTISPVLIGVSTTIPSPCFEASTKKNIISSPEEDHRVAFGIPVTP